MKKLFLIGVIFFLPMLTHAASMGSLEIKDSTIIQQGNSLQVAFSIKNISEEEQNIPYGIRLQSTSDKEVYEVPIDTLTLLPRDEIVQYANLPISPLIKGTHEVFIISRDKTGLISIVKYAGIIDITQQKPLKVSTSPSIKSCSLNDFEINCGLNTTTETSLDVHYSLHEGSKYGRLVSEGSFNSLEILNNSFAIPTDDTLSGGAYTYLLWINDKILAKDVLLRIKKVIPITPSEKDIKIVLEKEPKTNIFSQYMPILILILPGLLLVMLLYFALKRPKIGGFFLTTISFSISGIAFATMTLVDTQLSPSIFNAFSKDSGDVQFSINLDEDQFETVQNIGFTLVFQETALPNRKPLDGVIDMNIDGGLWQSLVTSLDASTISHHILPTIASPGIHTLNFKAPGQCASAFSFSVFTSAFFGKTDCLFSIPLTVTDIVNDAPTVPVIAGNCILGEPCSIGIISTDTDGGQLCYEAGLNQLDALSVGCAIEGTPVSIQRTFSSCSPSATTIVAQASDAFDKPSQWGVGSTALSGSILCTEACSHCTNTGGTQGQSQIAAFPPFISPTGTSTITWNLTNVHSCTIEARTLASDAFVESWDWNIIRSQNQRGTIVLTEATVYSLSCTDLDSVATVQKVTIGAAPTWQEL